MEPSAAPEMATSTSSLRDTSIPPASTSARGYTLPVWLALAARAAVAVLRGEPWEAERRLNLLEPLGWTSLPLRAAAPLPQGWALGEAVCEPGEGLDLTRGLVVWVLARWEPPLAASAAAEAGADSGWLQLEAGEGVGVHTASNHEASGQACLSAYARDLLRANLRPLVPPGQRLRLHVVLPAGRALAERTSNAAFGVVEGLALIGTQAETQASADPDQLQRTLAALAARLAAADFGGDLVLVLGENGLDLAPRLGLPRPLLLKTGNWVGPVLVAAGQGGVRRLLLFGYQGKLIKLAGGIFHTHHHLADGRAEVLTALAALEGLTGPPLEALYGAATVEAALARLQAADPGLAKRLRARLAATIEQRSAAYLARHGAGPMAIGAVLFDRGRQVCALGPVGGGLLEALKASA
ncbi:MAG: cobalt-precorrin-5B (C(1))-methyltransferase CbiD [Cyanobacteria bacterium]|nr:cobalt-precorrin-5B (C(1))-methyltransferase CbiD [Cyanobacteriota bacterium]